MRVISNNIMYSMSLSFNFVSSREQELLQEKLQNNLTMLMDFEIFDYRFLS